MATATATSTWTSEVNGNEKTATFAALLDKDVATKGSWAADYASYCEQLTVVACPFIKAAEIPTTEMTSVRAANAIIDLSSWRAMLLACCVTGSKVAEIAVHSCTLTSDHIVELCKALEKMGTCESLKLNYLTMTEGTPVEAWGEALKLVMSDSINVEFLSLKGCAFDDATFLPAIPSLSTNFRLRGLDLTGNSLTDTGATELFKALKLNTNLKLLSIASNKLSGEFLAAVYTLFSGSEATKEDEEANKANAKAAGDKNKVLKDTNKKRKKAGAPELPDYAAFAECIHKNENKQMILTNRALQLVDFSYNTDFFVDHARLFIGSVKGSADYATEATAKIKIILPSHIVAEVKAEMEDFASGWLAIVDKA